MKPGDVVQVRQSDFAILKPGAEPEPCDFWIYATVHQVITEPPSPRQGELGEIVGALVEVNHPANVEHGARKKVLRADLRTLEDVQAVHDAHPAKDAATLNFNFPAHKELNNLRAAIEHMKKAG